MQDRSDQVCEHGEPAAVVESSGRSTGRGRRFFRCARPPQQRCNFFSLMDRSSAVPGSSLRGRSDLRGNWRTQSTPSKNFSSPNKNSASILQQTAPSAQNAGDTAAEEPPHCKCGNPANRLTVRKPGPNLNKLFYVCVKPRAQQCGFFLWADEHQQNSTKSLSRPLSNKRPGPDVSPPRSGPPTSGGALPPGGDVQSRFHNVQGSAPKQWGVQQQNGTELSPGAIPNCACAIPAGKRTVKKENQNKGRLFFVCSKPLNEQCTFFEWGEAHPPAIGMPSGPCQQSSSVFGGAGNGGTASHPESSASTAQKGESYSVNGAVERSSGAHMAWQGGAPKRPRIAAVEVPISLTDSKSVSVSMITSIPREVKELIKTFEGAKTEKTGIFGSQKVLIPIEKVAEFEKYLQSRVGASVEYKVPFEVISRIIAFTNDEKKREEAGDVISTPLDQILPSTITEHLMDFQWNGVHFALKRGGRCLIGDDMGLGKTLQAIAVARVYVQDWPLLIVCPSSLRLNWREELLRWLPDDIDEDDVRVVMSGKDITKSLRRVNIVSYDLIRKFPGEFLKRCRFIIADESHYLKSTTAQRSQAVTPLVKNAKRAILLSGTPALSRPVELFAQVNALAPNLFPSYQGYVRRYCNAHQGRFGYDVSGSSNLDELHTVLQGTLLIRRKKDEVLTQLPPKQRHVVWVETKASVMKCITKKFAEFEAAKAEADAAETEDQAGYLAARVKGLQNELYALAAEAKINSILEFCKETAETGCKFIVFAHHTSVMDSIDSYLQKKLKLGIIRIDGRTPQASRQGLCKQFQKDDDKTRVALLSITAAGVGLTLTKATVVMFAELYWNPGSLLQAEDRAHRIGQHDSVLVKYLLAKKTLDESMWSTIRRKLLVVGQSLTGTAARMEVEQDRDESRDVDGIGDIRKAFRKKSESKRSSAGTVDPLDADLQEFSPGGLAEDDDDIALVSLTPSKPSANTESDKVFLDVDDTSAGVIVIDETSKDSLFPSRLEEVTIEPGVVAASEQEQKDGFTQTKVDHDYALARRLQAQYDEEVRRG